jgi:hypothetical protein
VIVENNFSFETQEDELRNAAHGLAGNYHYCAHGLKKQSFMRDNKEIYNMFQQNTGIHIRQLIESRETNFDE